MAAKSASTPQPAKPTFKYEEFKRYMMVFTLFCFAVAVCGMAASGSRVFTIAWGGMAVIVSLQALTRIIIWTVSSLDVVKGGAHERVKDTE